MAERIPNTNSSRWALAGLLKETASRWLGDDAPSLGAALSYYTVFSLAPLLLFAIAIAAFVFGRQAAEGQIVAQLSDMIGADSARMVQSMIQAAWKPSSGILASVLGVLTLLAGASGVLSELKDALNRIWRVPSTGGIGATIKTRLISFAMVLVIGFLLLVSLLLSTVVAALEKYMAGLLPLPGAVMESINFTVSLGVVTLLFALLFKVLPDTDVKWRDVWIGAVVTALLFTIGKWLLGFYLGRRTAESSYGAAGAILILLLWVYYSAQIFYFGAEFTKVYADLRGSDAPPGESHLERTPSSPNIRGRSRITITR